jgi:formylglycine-generating enzyme required for sulfatase activity
MKNLMRTTLAFATALGVAGMAEAKKCPQDSVQVGHLCVDTYEASAWEIPASDARLIKKVQKGKIRSAADLTGAVQRGATGDDYGAACPTNGAGCVNLYAVSIAGVTPAAFATWFQAASACANAGKRLLTNQEWTVAALGTPDPGPDNGTSDCNVSSALAVANTGSRSSCVSSRGVFDMVGNMDEWVADWVPRSTVCAGWGSFSDDFMCLAGADTAAGPGALIRGGGFVSGTGAGPLDLVGSFQPSQSAAFIGFRCAREL